MKHELVGKIMKKFAALRANFTDNSINRQQQLR